MKFGKEFLVVITLTGSNFFDCVVVNFILLGILKMQDVFPFSTLTQAIHFYLTNNPCRLKSQDLQSEPESPDTLVELRGGSSQDIWASTLLAIEATLKETRKNSTKYWAFVYRRLAPRDQVGGMDGSWKAVAKWTHITERLAKKYVRESEDYLTEELLRRGLISPLDAKFHYKEQQGVNH